MQVVKYSWINWEPFLIVQDGGLRGKIQLLDQTINLRIGQRSCIGHYKSGKWNPCTSGLEPSDGRYCNSCRLQDEFFLCVTCDGSQCINPLQRPACEKNVFFIYLAAFDNLLKVGISYDRRLLERLVEQGADFAAKVGMIQDGMVVRQVEQKICERLNIVDRVRGAVKQELLFGDPNRAMSNIMRSIRLLQDTDVKQYLTKPEIFDLRSYYKLDRISRHPSALPMCDGLVLSGTVRAAKGNILIIEQNHEFFSVNSHDVIGRHIHSNSQQTILEFAAPIGPL